jgi:iron complex transport system substrate-binding protein
VGGTQQASETHLTEQSSFTITDSAGSTHLFDHPVTRIISQNDDATELLIAVGAADTIVGITDTAMKKRYLLEKVPQATSIGDWLYPDIETILALKPDVIVAYSTSKPKNLDKLQDANITIIYCDSYRLNTLIADAEMIGKLTGKEERAQTFVEFHKKYLSLVKSRLPDNATGEARVYAEAYTDYSVMTQRSAGGNVLETLHVRNIYGNHTSDWATVSPEWLITENPDVIIKFSTDPAKGEHLSSVRGRILNRTGYSIVSAVKNDRVYVMNGEIGSSPRAVIGLVYAAKAIYPEQFKDIDPMEILIEYDRKFVANSTDFKDAFEPVLKKEI